MEFRHSSSAMSTQSNNVPMIDQAHPDPAQALSFTTTESWANLGPDAQVWDVPTSSTFSETERVFRALILPEPTQKKCMVPGCLIQNCNLGTHQKYKPKHGERTDTWHQSDSQASESFKQLLLWSPGNPSSEGVDGYPHLPIQETLDFGTRSLFHYFFTEAFDRLALLFRGPSVSNMSHFKERMLATALRSEAYCRALILQASTERERYTRDQSKIKQAMNLYSNALIAFREQLATIRQRPHPMQIELALLVVCILMMFDGAHGNREAQQVHWQGLRDLVSMRGGMRYVTTALAYVIHADRACAIRFEQVPTYASQLIQPVPMPIPPTSSISHGTGFEALKQSPIKVDSGVLDYLVEVSGLVGLWEPSRVYTSEERARRSVTSLDCLYYTRDRLDERFALLNARWAKVNSIERCLLSASRIVEYPVTWSNYVQTMTEIQCGKLSASLQQQKETLNTRHTESNLFTWMLFALTVVEPVLEKWSWAMSCLRDQLVKKYGPVPWRPMWWAEEQENLLAFTWSSSYYADRFSAICNELERLSCDEARSGSEHMKHEEQHNPI